MNHEVNSLFDLDVNSKITFLHPSLIGCCSYLDARGHKFLSQLCKMLSDVNIEIYISGIPVEAANKSSHVAIVVTARGGHIGFMEGMFPTNTYYSDRLYGQLVKGIFSNLEAMKKLKKEADDYARSCNSEAIGSES